MREKFESMVETTFDQVIPTDLKIEFTDDTPAGSTKPANDLGQDERIMERSSRKQFKRKNKNYTETAEVNIKDESLNGTVADFYKYFAYD